MKLKLIGINLLILLWICSISLAVKHRGKIYFEMISYHNPGSLKNNGDACDIMTFVKDYCDIIFNICLTSAKDKNEVKCDLLNLSTIGNIYHNVRMIRFGKSIGYIRNPIEIPMTYLPDSVRIAINVSDYDGTGEELIAQLKHAVQLYILPDNAGTETVDEIALNSVYSTLRMKIYGRCEFNYYGNRCEVFCKPSNSAETGYFGCDLKTGRKYCLNGWIGKDCRQPDLCVGPENRCHGSSVCFMKGRQLRCGCPASLKGKYCTEAVRPCKLAIENPCQNSGICVSHNDGGKETWKCQCPVGYRGDKCQYDVNECVNEDGKNTCINGGSCINKKGGYRCKCVLGYWGKLCEKPPVRSIVSVYSCEDLDNCPNAVALNNKLVIGTIAIRYEIFFSMLAISILLMLVTIFTIYKLICRSRKSDAHNGSLNLQYVPRESQESIYSECHYEVVDKKGKTPDSKPKPTTSNDKIDDFNVYEDEESDYIVNNCVSSV